MNRINRNEQREADATVKILESLSDATLREQELDDHRIGEWVRESVQVDLPPADSELKARLLDHLAGQGKQVADQRPSFSVRSTSRMVLRWSVAAMLLLSLGLWGLSEYNLRLANKSLSASGLKYQVATTVAPPMASELLDSGKSVFNAAPSADQAGETEIGYGYRLAPNLTLPSEIVVADKLNRPDALVANFNESGNLFVGSAVEGDSRTAATKYSSFGVTVRNGPINSIQDGVYYSAPQTSVNTRLFANHKGFAPEDRFKYGDSSLFRFQGEQSWDKVEGRDGIWLDFQANGEQYEALRENAFIQAIGEAAVSTFSIDVDTASYANMRRFINQNRLPPANSIRVEELVNYFKYDYPQPQGNNPFSVNMELATCPWNEGHKLLRVGLKGKEIHRDERPMTNLVFLIDVSGSMNNPNKLPLLKRGFQMMVDKLNENDRVSIVTYAGNAGCVLEPTSGDQKKKINAAIEALAPGGSTHGSAGIELAYKLAQENFIQDGANKVILATDGDLNVGVTSDSALVELIAQKASEGVFLSVLGFGTGNLKDAKLEKLADNGNGMYSYVDNLREAHKVLVEQMSGSIVTIAKDVKIQIEFNPAEVAGYRLIGYENRMLKTEDFANDQKDAGEIGAGHTVTALYELVTTDAQDPATNVAPPGMKYQVGNDVAQRPDPAKVKLSKAAQNGDLLTLSLRYKLPDENVSKKVEFTLANEDKSFSAASSEFRFAASVASFGMLLRGSHYAGDANPATVEEIAAGSIGEDVSGYRAEFVDLVRRVGSLKK